MTSPPALLLTRPQPQSERFAAQFQARVGAQGGTGPIVIAPLQEICALAGALNLSGVSGLVFTSETAVRQYVARVGVPDLPVWGVGPRTCDVARALGFGRIINGGGDAVSLAARIVQDAPKGPLLHPSGHHKASDLPQLLARAGVELRQSVIYEQRAVPLAEPARALLRGETPVLVPVFSPRSARLLRPEINAAKVSLRVVALSPAVADALGLPAQIAAQPNGASMLDVLLIARRGLMRP